MILHRNKPTPTMAVGREQRFGELPGKHAKYAQKGYAGFAPSDHKICSGDLLIQTKMSLIVYPSDLIRLYLAT